MRIIVFSELFYPHGGGAELATWLYAKMLSESGDANLTIVTRQFPSEPQTERVNKNMVIYRIPFPTVNGGRYGTLINIGRTLSNAIIKKLRESDIVYIPGGWYSAIPLAKAFRKPVVVHSHNYFIACPTSLMYDFVSGEVKPSSLKSFIIHEKVEKNRRTSETVVSAFMNECVGNFYRRFGIMVDAVIFVSKSQMDLALSFLPQIRDKSHLVYNPIPEVPLISAKEKGIAYLGGRSFVKGFHIMIKALKLLISSYQRFNKIGVFIAGASNREVHLNLNSVDVYLLPWLSRKKVEEVMEKTTITVIPSLLPEPSPYTLVESMLYGKIVIASNVGGIPEIVMGARKEGVKLFTPGKYALLADLIEETLQYPLNTLNEIGAGNRDTVIKKFDNKKSVKQLVRILYTLCA